MSIVDIMPTIVRHLGIKMHKDHEKEIDGVPIIGPVGATSFKASVNNNKIVTSWTARSKGKGSILLTPTNKFATGKRDEYKLLGKVDLQDGSASFDLPETDSKLIKLVLETPHNSLNRWLPIN